MLIILNACSKNEVTQPPIQQTDCLDIGYISLEKVDTTFRTQIFIDSIQLVGQCLEFTLAYSGCDANHDIRLYIQKEDGTVLLTNGLQLEFIDLSPEVCLAYFKQKYSYDLTEINNLLDSGDSVLLSFQRGRKTFSYTKP